MDYVKKFTSGGGDESENREGGRHNESSSSSSHHQDSTSSHQDKKESGGFLGGLGDKFNTAAGGGRESEKDEDMLDKGVDMFQEKVLGQGPQDNESALEQAKDEKISDFIRDKYKSATGSEIPIKDKPTKFS